MKFEIVDFYPAYRNPTWKKIPGKKPFGTLHVYWADQEIDLRGIHVLWSAKQQSFVFYSPFQTNFDPEEKRVVRYPCFAFTNPERFAEFKEFLKTEGSAFLEKYLQKNPQFDKRLKSKEMSNG